MWRCRLKILFCFCWKSLFAFNLNLWCNIFLRVFNQAGLFLKREYHPTIFFPSITFPVFFFDDETFLLWWCTLRRNYRKPKIEPQQSVVQCAEERTFCEIYDMLVAITDCCRRTTNSRYFYRSCRRRSRVENFENVITSRRIARQIHNQVVKRGVWTHVVCLFN